MFVTRKRLAAEIAYLNSRISDTNEMYYLLRAKHERLMAHLGITEVKVDKFELRTKGGPERG